MRVLTIAPSAFGGKRKGGGERYVSELVRALSRCGADAPLVTINIKNHVSLSLIPDGDMHNSGARRLVSECRLADIIHVHQLNSRAFDWAALASRITRTPLVLTDHGGGEVTPGRLLARKRLMFLSGAAFVSEWSRSDVDPHGRVGVYSTIYGGGDHLPPMHADVSRDYDFCFVGRLLPHKGVHILIEALPDGMSLVVAGQPRDADYVLHLKQLARGKNVNFRFDISDNGLSEIYRRSRITVVPSVSHYRERTFRRPELLGLVALESLASGTPVIGSDVAGLGELLREFRQLLVPPGDVDALRMALVNHDGARPLPDPRLYAWSSVADKCLALYARVIDAKEGTLR